MLVAGLSSGQLALGPAPLPDEKKKPVVSGATNTSTNPATNVNKPAAVTTTQSSASTDPDRFDSPSAYSGWAIKKAKTTQKAANEMAEPFEKGKKTPENHRVDWEAFRAIATEAQADRDRADAAIAAQLREIYKGDPKNRAATEQASHTIAASHSQDAEVQVAVTQALTMVLKETPQQRNTHVALYDVSVANDKLDALQAQQQADPSKPLKSQIDAALAVVGQKRAAMMATVGKELDGEIPKVTSAEAVKQDQRIVAANRIGQRYENNLELQTALDAEIILRKAMDYQAPADRMKALARSMPATLDPTTRAFVFSDARGIAIKQNYETWAVKSVAQAYDNAQNGYKDFDHSAEKDKLLAQGTPPALAATQKLLEVTDPHTYPNVKPDMVARIFNALRVQKGSDNQSTMDKVLSDLTLKGKGSMALMGKDNHQYPASDAHIEHKTYNDTIKNLSLAMDSMARAQDGSRGKYQYEGIQGEISYIGRQLAAHQEALRAPQDTPGLSQATTDPIASPYFASRLDIAFKKAAADGTLVLGFATATELKNDPKAVTQGLDPKEQANITLRYLRDGLDEFKTNTQELYDRTNKNMAPVSGAVSRFGMNLTEAEQQKGIDKIFTTRNGYKLHETMTKDRTDIEQWGYRTVRAGETVGFYEHHLKDLSGFQDVKKARGAALDTTAARNITLWSNSATSAIGMKAALKTLDPNRQHGVLMPQTYGWVAQLADMSEYLYETYGAQGKQASKQPGSAEFGTWGDPANRHPRFAMPPDVAGTEKIFVPGEGRKPGERIGKMTPNGRGGLYVKWLAKPHFDSSTYQATRLGRFPLAGLAVWGVGGGFQVGLTKFLYEEAGFAENEAWRKPVLLTLVGGFAAFHLAEAAMSATRLAMQAPAATTKLAQTIDQGLRHYRNQAPLIYQSFATEAERTRAWQRFIFTGTKGLTASLASLMGVAVLWDASGVAYRLGDNETRNPDKWWKVGTHSANLANDVLLARLQVREFSKRAAVAMGEQLLVERSKQALASRAAGGLAASRLVSFAASRTWMTANPIGFLVNMSYMATTGINWAVDQKRTELDLEMYDEAFLQGAGIRSDKADILKEHAFWTGDGEGDGFSLGYQPSGGKPENFVDYINSLDSRKLEAAMKAGATLPEHQLSSDKQPTLPMQAEYYLALTPQMNEEIAAKNPRFHYNPEKKRHEDALTQTYFDQGKWVYFGAKDAGSDADKLVSYDPLTHSVTKKEGNRTWKEEILIGGLKEKDPNKDHLALPEDPSKVDLKQFPSIRFNPTTKRFEDAKTGLYFQKGEKKNAWRREDNIGDMGFYYYPDEQAAAYYWPTGLKQTAMGPSGIEGWRAYLKAHDMLPPTDTKQTDKPGTEKPPVTLPPDVRRPPDVKRPENRKPPQQDKEEEAEEKVNFYKVKEGDSIWEIAGFDPRVVNQIYKLNPKFNKNLLDTGANGPDGRDPSALLIGEPIRLPNGFTPPKRKYSIAGR